MTIAILLALGACDSEEAQHDPTPCRQVVECSTGMPAPVEHPGLFWEQGEHPEPRNDCTAQLVDDLGLRYRRPSVDWWAFYLDWQMGNAVQVLRCRGALDGDCRDEEKHEEACDATGVEGVTYWPLEH